MAVILLFIALIVLLYFGYISSKGKLISPQFGFVLSFIPQVFLAIFYVGKWNLNLSIETFLLLFLGVLLFILVCNFAQYVIKPIKLCKYSRKKNKITIISGDQNVESWKLIVFIGFQCLTIGLLVRYLLSLASGVSLYNAILFYRYTNLFAEDTFKISGLIRMMRTICVSSGYIWMYLLLRSIIYKDKTNKLFLLANIALSLINDVVLGARTGIAIMIICGVVQYYFLNARKKGWKKAISFKAIFRILIIGCVFIASFQTLAEIMGRTLASEYNFMDYIAGYLSAPLKNLDVFINKGVFGSTIETNQTMNGIIPLLSQIFDHPEWIHKLDLPFVYERGHNFGNVYTVFYPFLYDLGYIGIVLYIPIMALISQLVYKSAMKNNENSIVSVPIVMYSYIYYTK